MSPVDFAAEAICVECGVALPNREWMPFCSEECWEVFDEAMLAIHGRAHFHSADEKRGETHHGSDA